MSEIEILPCPSPRCTQRDAPEIYPGIKHNILAYMVGCKCGVCGPDEPTESEAVEAWNEVAGMRQALEHADKMSGKDTAEYIELSKQYEALVDAFGRAVNEIVELRERLVN